MGHEIERDDGLALRDAAWHGLGTVVGEKMKAKEALKIAKMTDWDVRVVPLKVDLPNGDTVQVPDQYATVRGDNSKILGLVGERYTVVQNEALGEFAENLLDTGDAHVVSAGSLRGNRVVFMTLELERPVKVDKVDFKPYLNITSSHDGSYAWRAGVAPLIVVCMNTFKANLGHTDHEYYIKHTAGVADRIEEARQALRISFDYYDEFEAEMERLMDTDVTKRVRDNILTKVFPEGSTDRTKANAEERREAVLAILDEDEAAAPWKDSGWGLVNAVNVWELWAKPIRLTKGSPEDRHAARLERHALEHLRGDANPATAKAHELLVARRK